MAAIFQTINSKFIALYKKSIYVDSDFTLFEWTEDYIINTLFV